MQVVLLAAGMAQRLRPLTDLCPKCLLDVGGKSVLERAMDALMQFGLADFVIVTGYKASMIRERVEERYPKLFVAWTTNERYAETNNAYSLMLAESAVKGEFLLLDSDILFPSALVKKMLECHDLPSIALDRHPCGGEEIKVLLDAHGYVSDIGKDIEPSQAAGESIGIEVFSDAARQELFRTLRQRIVSEMRENEFYEASFKQMIGNGTKFRTVDTTEFAAMEIDSVEDLERARERYTADVR
jgi:choline kinase